MKYKELIDTINARTASITSQEELDDLDIAISIDPSFYESTSPVRVICDVLEEVFHNKTELVICVTGDHKDSAAVFYKNQFKDYMERVAKTVLELDTIQPGNVTHKVANIKCMFSLINHKYKKLLGDS